MDFAAKTQGLGERRGLLGRRDPAADHGVDTDDVPGTGGQVVGGFLVRARVHFARRDGDVERVGERLVRLDVLVAKRHLEPLVSELVQPATHANCVHEGVRTDGIDHESDAWPNLCANRRAQLDVALRVTPNVQLDRPETSLQPDVDLPLEIGERRVRQRARVRR